MRSARPAVREPARGGRPAAATTKAAHAAGTGSQRLAAKVAARSAPPRPAAPAAAPAVVRKAASKPTSKRAAQAAPAAAKRAAAGRRTAVKATPARGGRAVPVVRLARVRELDPWARCGPGTSVEQLYRVDEQVDGRAVAVHLVYFDQRGWYCVHGRACAAVADVHRELRSQRRAVLGLASTPRAVGR